MPISIRCEQGAKQSNGLDTWLGRLAMIGFATAITVEVVTGKGLLEVLSLQKLFLFSAKCQCTGSQAKLDFFLASQA